MSIKDEVRASAGAHRDLGPGYDTAVAGGRVERLGDEIDKRGAAPVARRVGEEGRGRGLRGRVGSRCLEGSASAAWCWASARWAWPSGGPGWCFIRAIPP